MAEILIVKPKPPFSNIDKENIRMTILRPRFIFIFWFNQCSIFKYFR